MKYHPYPGVLQPEIIRDPACPSAIPFSRKFWISSRAALVVTPSLRSAPRESWRSKRLRPWRWSQADQAWRNGMVPVL